MIIIDTKKPDNCAECPFHKEGIAKTICSLTDNGVGVAVSCYERMKDCPIKCEFEDIRAEINNSESDAFIEDEYGNIVDSAISFKKIMSIINKHIGG